MGRRQSNGPVGRRRALATILASQPAPAVHASGGRDRWSEPLAAAPADKHAALRAALGEVLDPELPISLLELGLVYGVAFDRGTARVDLTFTATACPCMDFIKRDVRDRIGSEPWVDAVEINEVWDPPWTTARISDAGRRKLKRMGVGA
jgi:metal-sulfur cluster biosynthetic enzyme